jgi:hypothetical protein
MKITFCWNPRDPRHRQSVPNGTQSARLDGIEFIDRGGPTREETVMTRLLRGTSGNDIIDAGGFDRVVFSDIGFGRDTVTGAQTATSSI